MKKFRNMLLPCVDSSIIHTCRIIRYYYENERTANVGSQCSDELFNCSLSEGILKKEQKWKGALLELEAHESVNQSGSLNSLSSVSLIANIETRIYSYLRDGEREKAVSLWAHYTQELFNQAAESGNTEVSRNQFDTLLILLSFYALVVEKRTQEAQDTLLLFGNFQDPRNICDPSGERVGKKEENNETLRAKLIIDTCCEAAFDNSAEVKSDSQHLDSIPSKLSNETDLCLIKSILNVLIGNESSNTIDPRTRLSFYEHAAQQLLPSFFSRNRLRSLTEVGSLEALSMDELHILMDRGEWKLALAAIPLVLNKDARAPGLREKKFSSSRRVIRKSLSALEKATDLAFRDYEQRRKDGWLNDGSVSIPWEGALYVWHSANRGGLKGGSLHRRRNISTSSSSLGKKELGRLLTLLSKASRWAECLSIFNHVLTYQKHLIDDFIVAEVLLSFARHNSKNYEEKKERRKPTASALDVWAAWRCASGDQVAPSSEMVDAFIRVGLYGSPEVATAACTLVKIAAEQRLKHSNFEEKEQKLHSTEDVHHIPLDFERNEKILLRLLQDRWTESWQAAVQVALVGRTAPLVEVVARRSPANYNVYEALTPALNGGDHSGTQNTKPIKLNESQRQALAIHWGTGNLFELTEEKKVSDERGKSENNTPKYFLQSKHSEEISRVSKVLDDLLGKD